MSVSEVAVDVVGESEETMEGAIEDMDDDASASDILQATCDINDATNAAAAAIAAVQKDDQLKQQADANLK